MAVRLERLQVEWLMSDLLSSQVKPNTQDFMSLIALKKHTLKYRY